MTPHPETAIIINRCHGRRLRVPTNRGPLDVKCPEPGCRHVEHYNPGQRLEPVVLSRPDARRQPVEIIVQPARDLEIVAPPLPEAVRRASGMERSLPMIKTVSRELRQRCAVTGAPFTAIFNRVGNAGSFVLFGVSAGDDLLERMHAKIAGMPGVIVEDPQPVDFAQDEIVFGNDYRCPCCGKQQPHGGLIYCRECDSYTCRGAVQELGGEEVNICHPQCPTHPNLHGLRRYHEPLRGRDMVVYQRDAA